MNQEQEAASEDLSIIVGLAIDGDEQSQNYLKELWPKCSWQTIKEQLSTEGSIWFDTAFFTTNPQQKSAYAFWMAGVNQHFINTVL